MGRLALDQAAGPVKEVQHLLAGIAVDRVIIGGIHAGPEHLLNAPRRVVRFGEADVGDLDVIQVGKGMKARDQGAKYFQ